MTPEQAVDAILDIFKSAWDPTGFPAHYTDKAGEKPTSETVWARVKVLHATGNQSTLSGEAGSRCFTNTGTVIVQIFAPIGDGATECYKASAIVCDAYRDARHSNVWFKEQRIQEVGGSDAFFQINVSSSFSYSDWR